MQVQAGSSDTTGTVPSRAARRSYVTPGGPEPPGAMLQIPASVVMETPLHTSQSPTAAQPPHLDAQPAGKRYGIGSPLPPQRESVVESIAHTPLQIQCKVVLPRPGSGAQAFVCCQCLLYEGPIVGPRQIPATSMCSTRALRWGLGSHVPCHTTVLRARVRVTNPQAKL